MNGATVGRMVGAVLMGLLLTQPAQAITWENAPPARGGKPPLAVGQTAPAPTTTGQTPAKPTAAHATKGMGMGGMSPPAFVLRDGDWASVVLWSPDLAATPLTAEQGRFTPPATGQDNYHLLWAQRLRGGVLETATRWYAGHGKPTGHSPNELTGATRAGLEVVPDPLPREHWRYQEEKSATFKIVLDGHPQPGVTVVLTTAQHTTLAGRSDDAGRVVFTLPTDLAGPTPDAPKSPFDRGPKGAMTVRAETAQGERHYTATLSADYYGGLSRDHAPAWGWAGATGGFAFGLVVLARRKLGGGEA